MYDGMSNIDEEVTSIGKTHRLPGNVITYLYFTLFYKCLWKDLDRGGSN